MLWFALSLLCAMSLATSDALSKKALKDTNEYLIAWVRLGYSVPFLLAILPFISIPHLDSTFWIAILILLPLDITAVVMDIENLRKTWTCPG